MIDTAGKGAVRNYAPTVDSRPIAAANQYRQTRIFRKPRILKRKLTPEENRPAIGLDPARMAAVPAEANGQEGIGVLSLEDMLGCAPTRFFAKSKMG
jgi:hypothetical protein